MSSATLPLVGLAVPSTERIASAGSSGTSMMAAHTRVSPDAANAAAPRPSTRRNARRGSERIPVPLLDDAVMLQRQGADALAGRREVGIQHRRRADRDGRLADAAPETARGHHVGL